MSGAIPPDVTLALASFAERKTILIALDFDGTLAPLGDDPEQSRMIDSAREALEKLTHMKGVAVALVTGRAIDSVKRVADPLPEWFLVGSHGIEVLSPGEFASYDTPWLVPEGLARDFEEVIDQHPGTRLERKPFGLALHTRGVNPTIAAQAESAAHQVCESWDGDFVVRTGHGIVECSINEATKGDGIRDIRERFEPDAVLFAGDDRTDEDGFAVLGERDIAIRVGGGETSAPYRLEDARAVGEALWHIVRARESGKVASAL